MSENHFIKIALIGAGSVATHLGLALHDAGFQVECVLNRGAERGEVLAQKLGARFVTATKDLHHPDLVIMAVSDDAIPVMARQLAGSALSVVHTSGTVSKDVLRETGPDYGVFYPFQTFSIQSDVDFSKVPVCIDASNETFSNQLEDLAHCLTGTVCLIDDEKRKILHLAGVFASNFSNYLYTIAEEILKKNEIPFELLLPLIRETAMKVQTTPPKAAQTGPAKRGDSSTIKEHLLLVQNEPELFEIYKLFTDHILRTYSHQIMQDDI